MTEIDRDLLAVAGLGPEFMHVSSHRHIHIPSMWMVYGCR
jgi:hypothetical protein